MSIRLTLCPEFGVVSPRKRVFVVELPELLTDQAAAALLIEWFPFAAAVAARTGVRGRGLWAAASPRVVESSSDGEGGYLADVAWEYLRSRDESERRAALLRDPAKGSA